jgi:inhibitor of cysteine peptidase
LAGPAATLLLTPEKWQAEVAITFPGEASGREQQIDRLFNETLAGRFRSDSVRSTLRKEVLADQSLSYTLRLEGSGGRDQFRKALFSATDPTLPFTDGPVRLILQGGHRPGERLPLTLEANLAGGYSWEVEALAGPGLMVSGKMDFIAQGNGLGVSSKQVIPLEALGEGESTLRLLYRRSWVEDRRPGKIMTIKADRLELLSDLTDPRPAPIVRDPFPAVAAPLNTTPVVGLPTAFDWRTSGILPPVRDQGACGSCWAFGTVTPFEANLRWKGGITEDLSEEFLLSCNTNGYSCNGGWWAHEYHLNKVAVNQTAPGAVLEASFPYQASQMACIQSFAHPYRLNSWSYVTNDSSIPSVTEIKNALYLYGPVAVAVCANSAMRSYRGGIFTDGDTRECSGGINHAVVLVGWNDAEDTWIMRNSWGSSWGENGYMRIKRGILNIGYSANYVTYANPFTPTHWFYFPLVRQGPQSPGPGQPLQNGDFEAGRNRSWGESSTNGFNLVLTPAEGLPITPHSGSWAAWLGGADYEISILIQRIIVPAGAESLRFQYWIGSKEFCFPGDPYDRAEVFLGAVLLQKYELCTNTGTGGWVEQSLGIAGFRGQTLDLIFKTTNDYSNNSNFFVDDVSIVTGAGDRVPIGFRRAP